MFTDKTSVGELLYGTNILLSTLGFVLAAVLPSYLLNGYAICTKYASTCNDRRVEQYEEVYMMVSARNNGCMAMYGYGGGLVKVK